MNSKALDKRIFVYVPPDPSNGCSDNVYFNYVRHSHVVFQDPETQDVMDFVTPWLLNFPGKAANALQQAGMDVPPKQPVAKCGYAMEQNVGSQNRGGYRGMLWFQATEHAQFVNTTTLDRANAALMGVYPSAEVGTTSAVCGAIALAILYGLYRCVGGPSLIPSFHRPTRSTRANRRNDEEQGYSLGGLNTNGPYRFYGARPSTTTRPEYPTEAHVHTTWDPDEETIFGR